MFTLCFVAFFRCFCLSFELHFLIHLAPLMHHLLPFFIASFLSLLPLDSFVYSWQKGGEYTGVFRHFYMTRVHILRGRNSTSCTFVRGESHRGYVYTKGEKTFFMRKPCFVCFTLCLLLSSHRVCVLDMHTSLCYCALLVACSDDHLFCYMIIIVIYIWLFCCMIKLLTCFASCFLDHN